MWVGGEFYAAVPGEEIPDGSLELTIKVPPGLKVFTFPMVLKLAEEEQSGEEEEQDAEFAEMGRVGGFGLGYVGL
jgi:hypothetical protein